jgi:alcohol dehydrogenase class IV
MSFIPDLSEKTGPVAVSGLAAGTVHAMLQIAGGYYDLQHGVLTAAMLPQVMAYNTWASRPSARARRSVIRAT